MYGYTDLGTFIEEENETYATNNLTFLVVNLKENFRIPVAYFLIKSLTGKERANLITICIRMLAEILVDVCVLTFDGASVNISMCNELGANFEYGTSSFQPWFINPGIGDRVYCIIDPCHAIKLVRNRFGLAKNSFNAMYDEEEREISFDDIILLFNKQEECGLHAANKLTNLHINFEKKKMNVALASQVLSASVSDALKFLQTSQVLPQSSGTSKFCHIFNNAFDLLNCRTGYVNFIKKPFMKPIQANTLQAIKT